MTPSMSQITAFRAPLAAMTTCVALPSATRVPSGRDTAASSLTDLPSALTTEAVMMRRSSTTAGRLKLTWSLAVRKPENPA